MTDATLARRLEALRARAPAPAIAAAARPARVWLVGGAVRDAALGRPTNDLDVVVERDAEVAARNLARALGGRVVALGGDRFAAHRVVAGEVTVDLWGLEGSPLAADLGRRDFTINAMAIALEDGELADPFGGGDDLARHLLRATRDTVFVEDPLRVVRLARLAATLAGFAAEHATAALARAAAAHLPAIAGERVRQELGVLWRDAGFGRAQEALEEAGAWPVIWLAAPGAALAPTASPAARRLDSALEGLRSTDDPAARIAAGHCLAAALAAGQSAAAAIESLAARRALSRAERHAALLLLDLATRRPPRSDSDLAWLLHRAGSLWPQTVALGRALAPSDLEADWAGALATAPALVGARGDALFAPPRLLRGEEIAELLGVPAGPAVGAANRRLREAQVRGEVADREAAARLVTALRRTPRGG